MITKCTPIFDVIRNACLDSVSLSWDPVNFRIDAFIIDALRMHFKANKCVFG